MIDLNLISPEQKKLVNSIRLYHLVRNILFLLASGVVITGVIFFFTYLVMQNNFESLQQQLDTEKSIIEQGKSTSVDEAIKQLNAQLLRAQTIQSTYVQWTTFLDKLVKEKEDGITFSNTQFNNSTQSFRIAGQARNRTVLLNWQEKLKTFPYFAKIISPISNLAQKENINFEITGQLTSAIYGT